MSRSKRRRESEMKSRKQSQNPHGRIKSLDDLSNEYDAEHGSTNT